MLMKSKPEHNNFAFFPFYNFFFDNKPSNWSSSKSFLECLIL